MQSKIEQQAKIKAAEARIESAYQVPVDRLPLDTRETAERVISKLGQVEVYRVFVTEKTGSMRVLPEPFMVAIFPDSHRAAVASNANSQWTDLDTPRGKPAAFEAVARMLCGEMCL